MTKEKTGSFGKIFLNNAPNKEYLDKSELYEFFGTY